MDYLTGYITNYPLLAPMLIFGLLLFAGFNLPVSEDVMLFVSAYLARKNPELILWYFFGVFAGAYFSDLISYWVGRILGTKLLESKFAPKFLTQKRLDKVRGFYAKYGMFTLIGARFIPFGVRNGFFMTAGLSKLRFSKFCFFDLIAASISCLIYFSLYFAYGHVIVEYIKKSNILIFSVFAIIIVYFLVGFWLKELKKKKKKTH
jgi:membrane-associated protein